VSCLSNTSKSAGEIKDTTSWILSFRSPSMRLCHCTLYNFHISRKEKVICAGSYLANEVTNLLIMLSSNSLFKQCNQTGVQNCIRMRVTNRCECIGSEKNWTIYS
jgi:hypothetical protein